MSLFTEPAIFDGHNDVLSKMFNTDGLASAQTFLTGWEGDIDLIKAKTGGLGGGFFAIYVSSPVDQGFKMEQMARPAYDLPLPDMVPQSEALAEVLGQAALLRRLEALGALKICTSTNDIRSCLASDKMAAIMHIEGAEAIDSDLYALEVLYQAGLRSLGPVWSRPTIFGHGVPFRFPSTGDTGPGLTEQGLALVDRCNQLGILLDLSHLNESGFWDIARRSSHPLVATHSNCHAISPHSRNLTDKQLAAIAESDGMVGLNFAVAFLRDDGKMLPDVPIETMMRHLDHLLEHLGEDRVGIGSDFDGAVIPEAISSAAGLPLLRQAMHERGYGAELMAKICHGNWLRVLDKTWGETQGNRT